MSNMEPKNTFIETYGCSANQNNSEIIAGILSRAGFLITNNIELAEIIIINTCIVKGKTESKIKRRIQDLRKDRNTKDKIVIITGCMPETDFKKLKKIDNKLIFLGTHHFKEVLNLIRDFYDNKLNDKKQQEYLSKVNEIKLNLPKKPQNSLISIHQISEGCIGNCSYCKTKLAKHQLFSYPQEEIIKSIESDLQNGAKELWLTSEDSGAYGLDKESKKHELPNLLKEISKIKHKFKIRIGMMNPNNILPILNEIIECYRDKKIFKFLHIPIQSASNKVLKDMNRFYKIEQVEQIINRFKKEFPDITIATDIIVGYPTETEEDHRENLKFIEKIKPEVLNLSKFSSHKQTPAGKLKVLQNSIVSKRAEEIMRVHRKTAEENKQKFLNKRVQVLIDKKISENLYEARDENYNIVLLNTKKENLGKELEVEIKKAGVHHLIGEIT